MASPETAGPSRMAALEASTVSRRYATSPRLTLVRIASSSAACEMAAAGSSSAELGKVKWCVFLLLSQRRKTHAAQDPGGDGREIGFGQHEIEEHLGQLAQIQRLGGAARTDRAPAAVQRQRLALHAPALLDGVLPLPLQIQWRGG